jgi:GDPmannose 4,6-dehydratase
LNTLIKLSNFKGKILIETDPTRLRPIDADLQIPNCEKFINHTGWKPEIKFEKTMEDLLGYWRKRIASGTQFLTR